ncbi:MAG: histidine phosphatase family protein [Bacteroidota bacterium]
MDRKKIYLVRHGQTDYNLQGVVQGSGIDAPINATGRAQAEAFFRTYRSVPFDRVYHSALLRTRQSVQGFIDLGLPTCMLPELNEISWGDFEGTPMTPEEGQYYQFMLHQWQLGNLDYAIAGGESPNAVAERLSKALEILLKDTGKTLLVCMHGRAIRIFLSILCQTDLKDMDQYEHNNLCLYLLEQNSETTFSILKHNDQDHLRGLTQP